MPHRFLRGARIRARRAQRRLAVVSGRATGYLLVYVAVVFTLPFIFKGPDSWRTGFGRGPGFPTPRAQGELIVPSDNDMRIRNGYYHDFDLVDTLDRITDHPRRFLNTPYLIMTRFLSKKVTAPVFADPWGPPLRNKTADLMGWLEKDTGNICSYTMETTGDAIATLDMHEFWCSLHDPAGERPAGHDVGDASAERAGPQDARCSAEIADKRDRLLHSALNFEEKMRPACREIGVVLWEASVKGFWSGVRQLIKERMDEMATDLEFLRGVFRSLDNAELAVRRQSTHLQGRRDSGGVRLEVIVSRAASDYPSDLDPFTAVLLHLLRDTTLLDSDINMSKSWSFSWNQILWKSPSLSQRIPRDLEWQAGIINTTSDLLASTILPGVREWSTFMRELEETDVFKTNWTPAGLIWLERLWQTDSDVVGTRFKAINDGADHLEFLRAYLVQLRHGLPGVMARLDLWDAEVAKLDDELTMVLKWGKKYTGRRQQHGERKSRGGDLEIKRWQINPSSFVWVRLGLERLERALNESWADSESFNPQDEGQDNWFESGMHRWSRSMLE